MTETISRDIMTTYALPVEAITDIISGAVEYAITYWADEVLWSPDIQTIVIHEEEGEEGNDSHTLTYGDILGSAIAVAQGKSGCNSAIREMVAEAFISYEDADLDADAYDVIIQFACFGEIVYG